MSFLEISRYGSLPLAHHERFVEYNIVHHISQSQRKARVGIPLGCSRSPVVRKGFKPLTLIG